MMAGSAPHAARGEPTSPTSKPVRSRTSQYDPTMLGNRIELAWQLDPLEAMARWPSDRPLAMLHSGRFDPRWARWTVLAEPVGAFRTFRDGRSELLGHLPGTAPTLTHHPWRDLRALLESGGDAPWIGYLGYEVARWIEAVPRIADDDRHAPVISLGHCPGFLVHDGLTGRWSAGGTWRDGRHPDLPRTARHRHSFRAGPPVSVVDRAGYERAVGAALDLIGQGDIFQVNFTQRFTCPFDGTSPGAGRALYQRLSRISPAWYGALIEPFDNSDTAIAGPTIVSTSPELFLEMDDERHVTTRPIKGTRPAHVDPEVLRRSEKDRAELNMIVDLLRNDLGRVCDYGSVRVDRPRSIESHPTVHHGVATISGQLHRSKDIVHLLRATMPGGSVTGAPKVRAMQIIETLEPVQRGPYCGAIGLLTRRRCALNIAIRTILADAPAGRADFSVGGGIVADSLPADEYDESMHKAAAMLAALRSPEDNPPVLHDAAATALSAQP